MKIKTILLLLCLSTMLSGCEFFHRYFHAYQPPVQQGNIISNQQVSRLRVGMTKLEVISIMGSPVLVNTFRDNTINYVYEYYVRMRPVLVKKVIVQFRNGRLSRIIR